MSITNILISITNLLIPALGLGLVWGLLKSNYNYIKSLEKQNKKLNDELQHLQNLEVLRDAFKSELQKINEEKKTNE